MTPPAVLFDLDGTLSDSAPGLIASLRAMHAAMGWPVPDDEALRGWLGPPTQATLVGLGHDATTVDAAMRAFRTALIEGGGLWQQRVYDGIPSLLAEVRAAGIPTGIVTFKLQQDADAVADRMGLRALVDVVHGRRDGDGHDSKAPLIMRALDELAVHADAAPGPVMVGDRMHDLEGAHGAGIAAIGVTWGYGSAAELRTAGALHVVDDVQALGRLLLP